MPEYLGSIQDVELITEAGKRFAKFDGGLKEVIVVSKSDFPSIPFKDVQEGYKIK